MAFEERSCVETGLIVQQAIANAVGHAEPTVLTLTLSYDGAYAEPVIADDGRGFNYTSKSAGFGVLGTQKRVREVSGVLRTGPLKSKGATGPAQGTGLCIVRENTRVIPPTLIVTAAAR